jgi:hypothetical protein
MGPSLLFESRLEVLSAVEDAEDGHYFGCDLEGDADAPPEAEDTQAGADVVSPRASHGEGFQAFTLLHDGIGVTGGNLRRGCRSNMEKERHQLCNEA